VFAKPISQPGCRHSKSLACFGIFRPQTKIKEMPVEIKTGFCRPLAEIGG
jgi:hypothetical protein